METVATSVTEKETPCAKCELEGSNAWYWRKTVDDTLSRIERELVEMKIELVRSSTELKTKVSMFIVGATIILALFQWGIQFFLTRMR